MSPERSSRAAEVFAAARYLGSEERLAFLDRACGEDDDLRREVERLLRHHDERRENEEDDLTVATETGSVSDPSGKPKVTVAGHRILQKIGEGGMGEVYRAEQVEPIRRPAALKVIKHGTETREIVARFESERQALAMMDHPNVARVFGGGTTGQGRPYFSMEYVQGVPITEYCDRHRLTTEDRLELFAQVCDGVQHAHQKGIIHRDIKPSNVLVTIRDDRATPKIIDFGIAKATQQRLTERSVFTVVGQLIGTPEYMSPEQAEMTQQDIDTRTDVYSLGVILYELLAGRLPFDPGELRAAGFAEMQRVIREVEPVKPSTRVSKAGARSSDAARIRRTDSRTLCRTLRGDLDWITMKALEKDRTRRYGSPAELAADIERHIRHQPVEAGPPSTAYRFRKFARRHRIGLAAASLVAIVVLGALVVSLGALAHARREASTANQVLQFLSRVLNASDPYVAKGEETTTRQVLDRAHASIDDELTDQPRVRVRLKDLMGRKRCQALTYDLTRYGARRNVVNFLDRERYSRGARFVTRG